MKTEICMEEKEGMIEDRKLVVQQETVKMVGGVQEASCDNRV